MKCDFPGLRTGVPVRHRPGRDVHVIPAEAVDDKSITDHFTTPYSAARGVFEAGRLARTSDSDSFWLQAVLTLPVPSVIHALRGNRDLNSQCAGAVMSCLGIRTLFSVCLDTFECRCIAAWHNRVQQIPPFCRRTGQSFWTPCNGQANHRQDLDDRAKTCDERAGRQPVARGKVRGRTGRNGPAPSVLRSQTFHGFPKPGAPPILRRSLHAQ